MSNICVLKCDEAHVLTDNHFCFLIYSYMFRREYLIR